MKKFLTILSIVLMLSLVVTCFVACNKPDDGGEPTGDTVTVSWYHGGKLLKEEQVAKGSKVASWTPDPVEGKEFGGWFSEASCTEAFDFETVINEDTDIFAKFTSNVYTEDTNEYYLIGTGAGDMGKAAWDHAKAEAELKMTKENVENANVYTITIKMYAGDRFQICFGGAWDGQQGIGYVQGAEYCDGVNEYDGATYTAADKKVISFFHSKNIFYMVTIGTGNIIFVVVSATFFCKKIKHTFTTLYSKYVLNINDKFKSY